MRFQHGDRKPYEFLWFFRSQSLDEVGPGLDLLGRGPLEDRGDGRQGAVPELRRLRRVREVGQGRRQREAVDDAVVQQRHLEGGGLLHPRKP